MYEAQKQFAKKMLQEAVTEHERKVAAEIKNGRNSSKYLQESVNKLQRKNFKIKM